MIQVQGSGTGLRLVTALTLLPLLALIVWMPALYWCFYAVIVVLAALGAREFFRMSRQAGIEVADRAGVALAALPPLGAALGMYTHAALMLAIFLLTTTHLISGRHTIAGLATSVFGMVYVGYCASFFVALHRMPDTGPGMVTLLVFCIGCSDTGAYMFGKAMGRHKLAPRVSPNKTIEGSAAALLCAGASGALLFGFKEMLHLPGFPAWSLWTYMLVALCLSVVGQLGDLVESLLKRNAGVKDSGTLFPGHGGVLDRCDAFLFGGPTLYSLVFLINHLSH